MKLPVIVAQSEVSSGYPQPEASLGLAAAPGRALAQAGQVGTGAALDTVRIHGAVQRELRKADAQNEFELAHGDFKQRVTDEHIKLRREGLDPDEYVPKLRDAMTRIGTELATSLKYPEAQQKFLGAVRQYAGDTLTKAKWDAEVLRHGQIEIMDTMLQSRDAAAAVVGPNATPQEREEAEAALRRGLQRPQDRVLQHIYTPERARAVTNTFLADVERGTVMRAYDDAPAQRPAIIRNLLAGQHPLIGTLQEQRTLAETMLRQAETAETKRQAELRRQVDEARETAMVDWVRRARSRELDLPTFEAELEASGVHLKPEEYERVRTHIEKKPDVKPSDPAILAEAAVRVRDPRVSQSDRAWLRHQLSTGALAVADYESLDDKAVATMRHGMDEAKSDARFRHSQGKDNIQTSLRYQNPLEILNQAAQQTMGAALDDYARLSSAMDGTQDPYAASRVVVRKYLPTITRAARARVQIERTQLPFGGDPVRLEQHYVGRAKDEYYNTQRRKILRLLDTEREIERMEYEIKQLKGTPKE